MQLYISTTHPVTPKTPLKNQHSYQPLSLYPLFFTPFHRGREIKSGNTKLRRGDHQQPPLNRYQGVLEIITATEAGSSREGSVGLSGNCSSAPKNTGRKPRVRQQHLCHCASGKKVLCLVIAASPALVCERAEASQMAPLMKPSV